MRTNFQLAREALLFSLIVYCASFLTFAISGLCDGIRCYEAWPLFLVSCIISSIVVYLISYYGYERIKGKATSLLCINIVQYSGLYMALSLPVRMERGDYFHYIEPTMYIFLYFYILLYIAIFPTIKYYNNIPK